MLVTLWTSDENRVTRDADFLAYGNPEEGHLKDVFSDVFLLKVEDGLIFETDALVTSPIREDQEYGGIRLKTIANLGRTRIPITIDIGFGDAVSDPNYMVSYPSLLDMPGASIRAYPPATVIAEKFHAIVTLGIANGRMKDYYDLWAIPGAMEIDPAELDNAIRATFERRGTEIPRTLPVGLSGEFVTDLQKSQQWVAYADSIDLGGLSLEEVVRTVRSYIEASCRRLNSA